MAQTIGTIIKDGLEYMKVWPRQKALYSLFPDGRIVAATEYSLKFTPPIAIIAAAALINFHGREYVPQAIAIAGFFLSLPLQGLLWLGYRSNQALSPALRAWYKEIHNKMREQGCQLQSVKMRPKYRELANLLKTAYEELDNVFTRYWF